MVRKLFKNKWYIIFILALTIADPAITSWMYLWLQDLYNGITIGTPRRLIIGTLLIGVSVWMGKRLLLFLVSIVKSKFICGIRLDLKHEIFANAMGLNTSDLSHIAASGEYISVLTNDITIIEQRYFSNIIGLISNVFSILILGSTFFTMNRKLAICVFAFSLLVLFIPSFFSKKLNRSNLQYATSLSNFTQKIKEFFGAYSTIKNYSVEKVICNKFDIQNSNVEDAKFDYDYSLALANSIGSLLTWFSRIVVIGVGLVLLSKGEILLGTVVAAQAFAEEIASPMQGLIENTNSIKSVKSIVGRISKITKSEKKEVDAISSPMDLEAETTISFDKLTVVAGGKCIVNDFTFTFKPNGKYLIIGKNGSGKSSLFKALKNRFSDYSGKIKICGTDIRELSNDQLSSLVSYLNENVSIFSASIKDNITFWGHFTPENLDVALSKAHIELSEGRLVGEDGHDISSGEQRRIEIARSMMISSKVLIYDEVVSTLDIETAYQIEKEALEYKDKTVIFISHNFSGKLIRKYDEILVLRDGCLIDHGTYDDLIKNCEYFKKICEIKFG